MREAIYAGLALIAAAILIVGGLLGQTLRRGRRRDQRVIDYLGRISRALNAGQDPDPEHLDRLAARPLTRGRLYDLLAELGRADLFPARYRSPVALAESDLAYWLAHPDELGDAPEEIELLGSVERSRRGGRTAEYFVFRFRTQPPHWAAAAGWLAGIAGPCIRSEPLRTMMDDTFSRFDRAEGRGLEEHVERCLDPSAPEVLRGHAPGRRRSAAPR